MLLYELRDTIREIDQADIQPEVLTVGCVSCEELMNCGKAWGFDDDTIEASQKANPLFRTGVDVREKYTFTELRVINRDGHEDFVSMFIKRNFILIVDIMDKDNSTINSFLQVIRKYPLEKINAERIILGFVEAMISDSNAISQELRNHLTAMEETIVSGEPDKNFNAELLEIKKKILNYNYFCEQLLDVVETLQENENEILDEDKLIYITNLSNRITRLNNEMNMQISTADHIQDAYATLLDQRMNHTMKIFTVITTIFFPLTIIVGWYGMNFEDMPQLSWKYGYPCVILLSVLVVALLIFIGKKKKWF